MDGLRALSIVAVVLYHADERLLPGGYRGVDVFFVISGFLITRLVLDGVARGRFSLSEFLDRRLRRIVPALVLVLGATLLLGHRMLFGEEFMRLGRQLVSGAAFLTNIVQLRDGADGGYFAVGAGANPLLHLWSLGIEEQFYLFWPILLVLIARRRPAAVTQRLVMCLAASFVAYAVLCRLHPSAAFYFPGARIWQLLAGGGLASHGWQRASDEIPQAAERRHRRPDGSGALGLALVIGSFWVDSPTWPGQLVGAAAATVGAALLIHAGPDGWLNRRFLSNRAMVVTGLLSYPWYLWHWPALVFARLWRPGLTLPGTAAAVVGSLLAAVLTWRLVELPLRRVPSRALRVPLLACLCAIVAAGLVVRSGGMQPSIALRFPELEQAVMDASGYARGRASSPQPPGASAPVRVTSSGATGGRRTVLFIGDSHAEQFEPRAAALADTLAALGTTISFAVLGGCPPLPGVSRTPDSCGSYIADAFRLARAPHVAVVVLGGYWEAYMLRPYDAHARNDTVPLPLRVEGASADDRIDLATGDGALVAAALRREVSDLLAMGKRVVIIASNPVASRFAPAEMIDRLTHRPRPPHPMQASDYRRYLAPVNAMLGSAIQGLGAELIDVTDALCRDGQCTMVDDAGRPMYRDKDHIRATVARRLTALDGVMLGAGSGPGPARRLPPAERER